MKKPKWSPKSDPGQKSMTKYKYYGVFNFIFIYIILVKK